MQPAHEPGEFTKAPLWMGPAGRQDLAFQKAMRRAVAAGEENPPMIGVFKDGRPSNAPRLFVPVEISSGCGSPARECADLNTVDAVVAEVPGLPRLPGLPGLPGRNDRPAKRSSRDAGSK